MKNETTFKMCVAWDLKKIKILNWLKENEIDIALMQETYITDNIIEEIKTDCENYVYFNNSGLIPL